MTFNTIYILGVVGVMGAFVASASTVILIARASMRLRGRVGDKYSYGTLLKLGARRIISAETGPDDPDDKHHFEVYALRMRRALLLLGVPVLFAILFTLLILFEGW